VKRVRPAAVICLLLLVLYAALAWGAAATKSPTYDEPLHVMAAWLQWHRGDFRVDPENPPLWKYWAALPNGSRAIDPPPTPQQVQGAADARLTAPFVIPPLFRSPGTDAERIVRRSRAMMLVIALTLGGFVAWWAWKLGGEVAAVVATAAFALDPNFLAHGPLVKNDVVLALALLGATVAVWHAGRRVTWRNALAVALLCAVAVNVKFSALIFGPIAILLLLIRALMRWPWECAGRTIDSRSGRVGVALGIGAFALIVSYAGVWASYQFRFAPAADAQAHLGAPGMLEELISRRPGPMLDALRFVYDHRLLPEAWLSGLLSTYEVSLSHANYLLGRVSSSGWWYYFPLGMVVKSPVALIGALVVALVIALNVALTRKIDRGLAWNAACVVLPPVIFLLAAMTSNLNYGVRHVLGVFPFLYIGIGLAAAYAWRRSRGPTAVVAGALALLLAFETLGAFPNYIAFFNLVAGGSRGGFELLGDSNLDWGQDLKLLADWQRHHPDADLYLSYYGGADPAYYGIRYHNLPGGIGPPAEAATLPASRGHVIIAVSATTLQGIYLPARLREFYDPLRHVPPTEVLGGSIYLFDLSSP
jgi:hypothetical protein